MVSEMSSLDTPERSPALIISCRHSTISRPAPPRRTPSPGAAVCENVACGTSWSAWRHEVAVGDSQVAQESAAGERSEAGCARDHSMQALRYAERAECVDVRLVWNKPDRSGR